MSTDWDDVSYIISSNYRIAVVRRLADSPATPSRIARDVDIPIAHVSRSLAGLREREIVDLLVSEHRQKGRVYGITDYGLEVWETMETENLV